MAVKNDDILGMTDAQLMKEWTSLGKKVETDRARLSAFSEEHQARTRLAQLNLEPGDLALIQSTTPEYIESQEKVNG